MQAFGDPRTDYDVTQELAKCCQKAGEPVKLFATRFELLHREVYGETEAIVEPF